MGAAEAFSCRICGTQLGLSSAVGPPAFDVRVGAPRRDIEPPHASSTTGAPRRDLEQPVASNCQATPPGGQYFGHVPARSPQPTEMPGRAEVPPSRNYAGMATESRPMEADNRLAQAQAAQEGSSKRRTPSAKGDRGAQAIPLPPVIPLGDGPVANPDTSVIALADGPLDKPVPIDAATDSTAPHKLPPVSVSPLIAHWPSWKGCKQA